MNPLFALFVDRSRPTLVILSQVYVPDPAAVGQYMHDVAVEMVRRGRRVVVFTADRGYDGPETQYPSYEFLDGVHVVRVPWSSFGKANLVSRLLGGGLFLSQATLLAACLRRIDRLLVSTSPPISGLSALALRGLRNSPLTYWVMDLNPDQIVAAGMMGADALPARALDWLNRRVINESEAVIALDSFMAERLRGKQVIEGKLAVVPLWPLIDSPSEPSDPDTNTFRQRHGLVGARVVMYSGNLSRVHPLTTLLEAIPQLRSYPQLRFVFVGSGAGRAAIERARTLHGLTNLLILPYQPLASLAESLAAADVHLVAMGDEMVGIVHPSKLYSALAVGRPILSLGPERSHIADLVRSERVGWHVRHGDREGMESILREIARSDRATLTQMGRRASALVARHLSRAKLLGQFCGLL